jgi:hypothetical protein
MYGNGIFDRKLDYTNKAKNVLKDYGKCRILEMKIYRTPIAKSIDSAFNVISLGIWSREKKKYSFDKLFHLALVITVECRDSNKLVDIIVEKNEIINISRSYNVTENTETFPVLINKVITVDKLLNNTLKKIGKRQFFIYDGFYSNCQMFIRDILISNNLYNKKIDDFVFQDISKILLKMPKYVHRIQKAVTDLGAFYSKFTGKRLSGGCNSCIKSGCLKCGICDRVDCDNKCDDDLDKITDFVINLLK